MKNKIKLVIAMVLIIIVFLVVVIIASMSAIDKITVPTIVTPLPTVMATKEPTNSNITTPNNSDTNPMLTPNNTIIPIVTIEPTQTEILTPTINPNAPINNGEAFAMITISTERKSRTYAIMADVNEKTLKDNIGWLPSSALPGQEGFCVLMGHRDTDFSILKYAEYGDVFIIAMNDIEYNFMVSDIEVIESDNELRFIATDKSVLALVTCYPFRYSGHAPKKYVVTAVSIH